MRKKLLALIGALITGGLGIAVVSSVPAVLAAASAESGVALN
jgi:hypothetical protein